MGIIAIKTERTQIHISSDILVTVASLDLKVHYNGAKLQRADHESAEFTYRIGVHTKPDRFSWQHEKLCGLDPVYMEWGTPV